MKSFDRLKLSRGPLLAALLLLVLTSCNKEVVEKQYPAELTIQNWMEFVDAPQEVIDELERQERQALAENNPYVATPKVYASPETAAVGEDGLQKTATTVEGIVQAYGGSNWSYFGGVLVSKTAGFISCGATTTSNAIPAHAPSNYVLTCNNPVFSSPLRCLSKSVNVMNGVTTLDLLEIQRHILGITPFTSWRQMVAADVNDDGNVSSLDIAIMRNILLGNISSFPIGNGNLRFVSEGIYNYNNAEWMNAGIFISYSFIYPNSIGYNCGVEDNYRAIKMGDVNGTFSF